MPPETRRRKACKECRLHKIKCDGEPPQHTCSRCRRMDLQCVLNTNPGARKTKAQLQRELEALRQNANHETASSSSSTDKQPGIPLGPLPVNTICPRGSRDPLSQTSDDGDCSSQELDGQIIEASKIKDCFNIFFERYVPCLPVLDPHTSPDEYYQLSPFLFWAIVFVGSRKYSRDPTLVQRLSSRINTMALLSLESRDSPIQTIQGLLLLCVWPVPINTAQKDISHVLSGAAMTLATQIGLHVTGTGQEFARVKLDSNRSQNLFRAQLWIHCVMICNSVSIREGIPPLTLANFAMSILDSQGLLAEIPRDVRVKWEMHKILISATTAILRALPTATSTILPSPLSPLIGLFDSQLLDLVSPSMEPLDFVYLHCCRLDILAYYFLEPLESLNKEGLLRLYTVACGFIQDMTAQDEGDHRNELCTTFVERTITLAAISILKIHRSELAPFVDLDAGEKTYFSAILLVRKASIENDDLGARAASILSQLWTSQKAFRRRPDGRGGKGLETKIRSRLSMSAVFDAFWWWREEFAGKINPYKDEDQSPPPPEVVSLGPPPPPPPSEPNLDVSQIAPEALAPVDPMDAIFMFDNGPFPDYDWAANMDIGDFDPVAMDHLHGGST